MTIYEKYKVLTPQEQRLYNNRVMLANQEPPKNDPPGLPNSTLLPATADDPGQQLQYKDRLFNLDVDVSEFPDASSPDRAQITVQAMWDGTKFGRVERFQTPLTRAEIDAKFPIRLAVDAGRLNAAGPHQLSYWQTYSINGDESKKLSINIDTEPPVPVGKVGVPAEIEADLTITKAYLDTHGFVRLTCKEWSGAKIGDVIEFRYGRSIPNSRLIERIERNDLGILPSTDKLTKEFIGSAEGDYSLFFVLFDRKGNPSLLSEFLTLDVVLSDPPANQTLQVALHDDDDQILVEDAQTPVIAKISYDNWLPQDRLLLSVDGQPAINVAVTQVPFSLPLPYKYLHNGNVGPKTVPLLWQIQRNKLFHPKTPTPKDLNIDLDSPLPIDPDNPGLPGFPHDKLLPVTVQGTVTTDPNKIRAGDLAADVDAKVLIYEGFKTGQVVSLYVEGVAVPEDPANTRGKGGVWTMDGTETATTMLTFTIAPEIIEASGNNPLTKVHYNVTHSLNENFNRSKDQEVDVFLVPVTIPKPKFLHTVDDLDGPTLGCISIKDDSLLGKVIEVEVPGGELKLANQELLFVYQGYVNDLSSPPDNKPGSPIPGNTVTVKKTPSTVEARDGFLVKIPYAQFAVTNDGWGDLKYTALIDGQPASGGSDPTKVTMRIGGGTCPI
ncbi:MULTISPECIES: hypothetical protein [unclassified Pseudomonas]|uniref:hypothetical protein n=1 Tax=unclassified Pseudomonas TaxID=196821 RepID=UPI000270C3FC|nr:MULTISPECIES: hypothetical protein [unclassified Pseudomonas]EJM87649.1 hypothetical protein PMI33_03023 [Pseudomonas sp. GM67]MBD9547727.1 hypothetical protein [Pseudomonas sp. PDM01]